MKSVIAVSGGPDSVYLVSMEKRTGGPLLLAHFNHRARGKESDDDQEFVESLGRALEIPVAIGAAEVGRPGSARYRKRKAPQHPAGFEEQARTARYAFLKDVAKRRGAQRLLLAHTADDQVETVLMRVIEGAGISGLKGIPRETADGIVRPLLDTWRSDILAYLHAHKIPYRIDKSNLDTRFERNWIRHVLIPMLEKRYGRAVKKRLFALGERFRELDSLLEYSVRKWMKRNLNIDRKAGGSGLDGAIDGYVFRRASYAGLPAALRKKILQCLSYERVGTDPNERLLESMDRLILSGKPSGRLSIGKGSVLSLRYEEALLSIGGGPGNHPIEWKKGGATRFGIVWEEGGRIPADRLRRLAAGERGAAFDAGALRLPLAVRPLRTGDRITPFGMDAEKKVKEILIDRKVPRDERWGRRAVCDAEGEILWIPGVVRSAHAPVRSRTTRTVVLRIAR